MLDEPAFVHHVEECIAGREVVFPSILLACAGCACCVRDTEAELVRIVFEEALEEGGFAGAAGTGDDYRLRGGSS